MVDFTLHFPDNFLWGTATAAHQVEGHNTANNWAAWERQPGRIYQDQTAGAACDWWSGRYEEDFDRAAEMSNNAHRFSVEWSRIEPEPGRYDDAALRFYVDMVAALRKRGMEPMVTLHHFTNPQWIEQNGGWRNPETVERFEQFTRVVVDALGDYVTLWCTINEPMIFATMGYLQGHFPPGKHSLGAATRVVENMLRGHAAAYYAIKELFPQAQVGLAQHMLSQKTRFPRAVHQPALRTIRNAFNRAFVEALNTGTLRLPLRKVEVPQAAGTLDWIGLNYYYRFDVMFNLLHPGQLFLHQTQPREGILGPERVGESWPEGLFEHIKWLCTATGKPLYVTENGVPDPDDSLRPLHMVRSLRSVWRAIMHNYPVRGYFAWTLVDNFEWAEGYDPAFNFGLYACDHETQVRTRRRSAELYGEIASANGLTAEMIRRYLPDRAEELIPSVSVQQEVTLPQRY